MAKKEVKGIKAWLDSQKIINKTAGELLNIDRLLTGVFTLDLALDGGIPKNKITEIFGDKSMGKTSLALSIVKNAFSENLSVLYIDAENTLSASSLIKNLGLEKLEVVIPSYLEQMGDTVLKSVPEFDLIVVDSLTSLPPIIEYNEGIEKVQQAMTARVLGKFFRLLSVELIKYNSTILILNQIRESIGQFKAVVAPGGKAQDFAASLQIHLKSGSYDEIKGTDEDNIAKPDNYKRVNMKHTVFEIIKSRVSTPKRYGDFYLVVKKFKDYKVGEIYNESIIRSYCRNKFIDMEWFPEYKTQEQLINEVRVYEKYKQFINLLLDKGVGQ